MRNLCSCLAAAAAALVLNAVPCAFAATAGVMENRIPVSPLAARDVAFDLRHDLTHVEGGPAAAYKFTEEEAAKNPSPHIKARLGEYLLAGKTWGAPEGRGEEGSRLVDEALAAGSMHAMNVVGWELLAGRSRPQDVVRGLGYLQQGATEDYVPAMMALGDIYRRGFAVPKNRFAAEVWLVRAARLGQPHFLFRLAASHENGEMTAQPDVAYACRLYYEAAINGSAAARDRIHQLAEAGNSDAVRAKHLMLLCYVARGADPVTSRVRTAVTELESKYPDDPEVLTAIGRAYWSEELGNPDFKKAFAYFSRAADKGSDVARAFRARLLIEGYGTKRDIAAGMAEWAQLEARNVPEAVAQLGYFHYWGPVAAAGIKKDAQKAFALSKRAADWGDYYGQLNTAACYEFGIGVPTDYALAAYYYRAADGKGSVRARAKVRRLLPHIR